MEMEKNVDFENLALVIQKPKLNTDKSILIQGNFSELSEKIRSVVDRYKDEVLTDDNVGYIKTLKSQFVSLRTGIERERKEYKKAYLDPATKLVNSMCDELQKIVQEGEDALSSQLDAYDQKRKDELTVVLKEYIEDASLRHSLREEYKEKIKILDKYYNKTQKEEDSCDDIERQAAELERQQKEYDASLNLIKRECSESGLLEEPYIRQLQYQSVAEIITQIKEDSQAKEEVENYFNNGNKELSTESGKWIVENINEFIKSNGIKVKDIKSEVMVSDFEGTASNIDIVITSLDGTSYLFDIKTGNFDRPYCSLQLSCYKYLFELCYNIKVRGLYVLHTKTKKRFHIIEQDDSKVQKILDMNKAQ